MFLLEDPWPVILMAAVAEAVLAIVLWRTGRGVLLVAMLALLAVAGALVGLEWLVVTEREEVEQAILAGAAAIESNNPDAALSYHTPGNPEISRMVRWAMNRVEFKRVKVTHLEVGEINRLASPPMVRARVIGIVEFEDRRGQIPYNTRPFDLELVMRQSEGRWLVESHEWRADRPPGAP